MTSYVSVIELIRNEKNYRTKENILSMVAQMLQNDRRRVGVEQVTSFIFEEIEVLIAQIPLQNTYQEKDAMIGYETALMQILIMLYPSAKSIPQEKLLRMQTLEDIVARETFLERDINRLFTEERIERGAVEALIETVSKIEEEYHRGIFFMGLLNYKEKLEKLFSSERTIMGAYIQAEIKRLASLGNSMTEDQKNSLELACDVCKYFLTDDMTEQLYAVLQLGDAALAYYCAETLLFGKKDLPQEAVNLLAKDLMYANLFYLLLEKYGKSELFPAYLADAEYLAKSDLVHWLAYPTELGKAPDRIEYLGCVTKKKEIFHVFRYTSDSDNLGDDLKNRWLIGWSSNDGGTFSEFEPYDLFEKKTPEKTLKYIAKKAL